MADGYSQAGAAVGTGDKFAVDRDSSGGTWAYTKLAFGQSGTQTEVGETTPLPVAPIPAAVAPVVSGEPEASHVLKMAAGGLASLCIVIGAASGWLMLFDATSVPADGGVAPIFMFPITSDGSKGAQNLSWGAAPLGFVTGLVAVFSTTGPLIKTASPTAIFSAQVR